MEHHNSQSQDLKPSPNNSSNLSIPISILAISLLVLYVSLTPAPPSTLFKDTTFCFLLSNTIIVVVATDSGVFSSSTSPDKTDNLYNELVEHNKFRSRKESAVSLPPRQLPDMVAGDDSRQPPLPTIYLVGAEPPPPVKEIPVSTIDLLAVEVEPPPPVQESSEGASCDRPFWKGRRCDRSRSEIVVKQRDDRKVLRRSATEKRSSSWVVESEYSRMTDEEVNRRAEEFIRRFKQCLVSEAMGAVTT